MHSNHAMTSDFIKKLNLSDKIEVWPWSEYSWLYFIYIVQAEPKLETLYIPSNFFDMFNNVVRVISD